MGMASMARLEMMDATLSTMAAAKPTGDDLFELGMIYSAGVEVAANFVEAHKWFNLAAIRGNSSAATYRQEVAREMSAADVAAAQRAAREWLTRH
jgi:TPR repeat protein